jgi:hypothetical protein
MRDDMDGFFFSLDLLDGAAIIVPYCLPISMFSTTYSTKKPLFLSAAGVLDLLERGTISA